MTDPLLSIFLGIGLSAATGFRVFVPLLIMSIAAQSGSLTLSPDMAWIGTAPAMIVFGVATLLEVGGYFIPWLDNLLDTIATPAAVVAGAIVSASVITNIDPALRWTLAIIAGGGIAALIQGLTVVTRATSTGATGGCANPAIAIVELIGSIFMALLALLLPLVAGAAVVALLILAARKASGRIRRMRKGSV
jgi:hypothetical protein